MIISRLTHVAANGIISFFSVAESYSTVCVHVYIYIYIFFIHPSVNGHLVCFHDLAVVYSAAMNIGVHVSFQVMVSLDRYPGVDLLNQIIILVLVF